MGARSSTSRPPPPTSAWLGLIERFVAQETAKQGVARERVQFTRRELREQLGLGDTQLKVHLARLVSLELVHVTRGPHGAYHYQLAWEPTSQDDEPRLPGLIDPDHADRPVPESDRSGAGRPPVGPQSAREQGADGGEKSASNGASAPHVDPAGGEVADEQSRASFSAAAVAVTPTARAG